MNKQKDEYLVKPNRQAYRFPSVFLSLFLTFLLFTGCSLPLNSGSTASVTSSSQEQTSGIQLDINGRYSLAEEVAAYLNQFDKLPPNYINKGEATKLGWESQQGNLWQVTDQMSIGGDRFGNREGLLPDEPGRFWYECDVNYSGGFRGAERLVYSNDGLIYYTGDHYRSFKRWYPQGEDE